jgi:hypothetical protein
VCIPLHAAIAVQRCHDTSLGMTSAVQIPTGGAGRGEWVDLGHLPVSDEATSTMMAGQGSSGNGHGVSYIISAYMYF